MNSVSLALDCFVVGKDVSALSDLTKPTLGQIIKLGGRTLAVDALTYGASYGTTAVLEDTNLPNELKLLLSLGVGLAVSHVSGKYLIKSADGNVISEVDENTFKGAGGAKNSNEYSTAIDDKVTVINKKELPESLGNTFTDGEYCTVVTNEEIKVYRTFGGKADARGGFATTNSSNSRIQSKIDSALLPEWGNTRAYEVEITILTNHL